MRVLTKIILIVVAVVYGFVFIQNDGIKMLLFVFALAAILASIYLVCSSVFEKLGSSLGSSLGRTLFGDNANSLIDQDKYNEAMGYTNFGLNKVEITENQICIQQYSYLYNCLFLLTILVFCIAYAVLSGEISISFSDENFENKLNIIMIGAVWPMYMLYVNISNIFFSTYLTIISINDGKLSLKKRFGKEKIFHVNHFQFISFSYSRYFDGTRHVYYQVFMHFNGDKYSILCDLAYKKQVQFAISSLQAAIRKPHPARAEMNNIVGEQ